MEVHTLERGMTFPEKSDSRTENTPELDSDSDSGGENDDSEDALEIPRTMVTECFEVSGEMVNREKNLKAGDGDEGDMMMADGDIVVPYGVRYLLITSKVNIKINLPKMGKKRVNHGERFRSPILTIKNLRGGTEHKIFPHGDNRINISLLEYKLGRSGRVDLTFLGDTWITL